MHQGKPIFYDEDRRRWRRTRRLLEITGAVFTVVLVVFFLTIVERVSLPELLLPSARASRRAMVTKGKATPPAAATRRGRHSRVAALGQAPANYDPL
jgi:peptidoglycan-N-acetylglucosamine deacetylase